MSTDGRAPEADAPARSPAQRMRAVRHVVDAARAVAAGRNALTEALVRDTGLTPEGVAWAFAHHLETSPSDDDVAQLVASTTPRGRVAVILSANVFTAGLRAVALAVAAAPHVVVRPSRREPTFATALVGALADANVTLDASLRVDAVTEGEIHVYGRDATIADVRAHARNGVRVWGHGAGMGVAFVSADARLDDAAADLARDVVAFDQRGCLSPRIALVEGADARASTFARALHEALDALGVEVPRGRLGRDEGAEARRFLDAMAFVGEVHAGAGHAVAAAPAGTPIVVPPTGRHVLVMAASDVDSARLALAPFARALVAVGGDSEAAAARIAPPHARVSRLGEMQRPPFDGPVDHRHRPI